MKPREAAEKYMDEGRLMQLGTLHGKDQPRVNTVYYVTSADYRNVYWLSEPDRQHSVDLRKNPRVAGAVAIKADLPVIGLQFTGVAGEVIDHTEIKTAVDRYNAKYDNSAGAFYDRVLRGKNKHRLYRMSITRLELFDEIHFGNDPIEISLS